MAALSEELPVVSSGAREPSLRPVNDPPTKDDVAAEDAPLVSKSSRQRRLLRQLNLVWPPLLGLVACITIWAVISANTDDTVLPSPLRVVKSGWIARTRLWHNTLPTLAEAGIGLAIALVGGVILASVIDQFRWVRRMLYPLLVGSQTIPIIVIAPLFILWFGFGPVPKIFMVVLVTGFPITVGMMDGLARTHGDAAQLVRSFGAGRIQELRYLRIPGAMPSFFTGVRVAVTFAVTAAVFGEYVGATEGLGIYMQLMTGAHRTDLVLATVIVIAVVSIVLYGLTFVVERIVTPWHAVTREGAGR